MFQDGRGAGDAMTTLPLLQIRNVSVWFPVAVAWQLRARRHVKAVDGVSLELDVGQTLGIVGESGCGKTTLARTIVGLERPTAGDVVFNRTGPRYSLVQMVFQDPLASLNPRMAVIDILTEGLLAHDLIRSGGVREAALGLLADVGMDADALLRYPHEFSGGQRQRIGIARALALKPALIVCDEAVSMLDVSVRVQILNLLRDLQARHGMAYLFIAHDLGVVRYIADRIAVMYMGQIVEQGPAEVVLRQPSHPYTMALRASAPDPFRKEQAPFVLAGDVPSPTDPPPGCRFHTRCPYVIDMCRSAKPPLEPVAARSAACVSAACWRKDELACGPLPATSMPAR